MSRPQIGIIDCPFTGKKEEYEIQEFKTRPSGTGGTVYRFPQEPSCLNYQCKHRDMPECPLKSLSR